MNNHEDILQQMMRIARSGQAFYAAVYPNVKDAEVRAAFEYIYEVKGRLISDLTSWVTNAASDPADHISPAATVEKMYADVRRTFDGNQPAASASALSFGEEQLLRLVERAFEGSEGETLKELFKTYYSQLVICREAMLRLRSRLAA